MRSLLFSLLILLGAAPTRAGATTPDTCPQPARIVVIDMRQNVASGVRFLALDPRSRVAPVRALSDSLHIATCSDTTGAANGAGPTVKEIARLLREEAVTLERASSPRWISRSRQLLSIYVLHNGEAAAVSVGEKARSSRLGADLKTLAALVAELAKPRVSLAPGDATARIGRTEYRLVRDRAELAITVVVSASPKPDTVRQVLVTGPREHVFVTANAVSATPGRWRYDTKADSLERKYDASEFLVGLGFLPLGDVTSGASWSRLYEAFYIGAVAEASRRPFQQIGLVAGFRIPGIEALSPHGGVRWLRNDRLPGADGKVDRYYGGRNFFLGLSFDLSQGLTWLGAGS